MVECDGRTRLDGGRCFLSKQETDQDKRQILSHSLPIERFFGPVMYFGSRKGVVGCIVVAAFLTSLTAKCILRFKTHYH